MLCSSYAYVGWRCNAFGTLCFHPTSPCFHCDLRAVSLIPSLVVHCTCMSVDTVITQAYLSGNESSLTFNAFWFPPKQDVVLFPPLFPLNLLSLFPQTQGDTASWASFFLCFFCTDYTWTVCGGLKPCINISLEVGQLEAESYVLNQFCYLVTSISDWIACPHKHNVDETCCQKLQQCFPRVRLAYKEA